MMNLTDLLIIYLACGSPFGVYYFLHNRRRRQNTHLFWLKTILIFFMWLPFAVRLLLNKVGTDQSHYLEIKKEKSLFSIQKQIEAILLETSLPVSIYELREIFDRYVGLTLVNTDKNAADIKSNKEFFQISDHSDAGLAARCYERRNRKRLSFHHTLARQDFLSLIGEMSSCSKQKELGNLAVEFAAVLNDSESLKVLETIFTANSQTAHQFTVTDTEKDLWKPEKHKPLPVISPISTQLQTMTAATNSRSKD